MIRVEITTELLDYAKEMAELKSSLEVGSIVSFLGVVRSERGEVKSLLYERYEEMGEEMLKKIAEEAIEKFGIERMTIIHRWGQIPAGEDVVFCGASSVHRSEGFEACSWVMDRIKEIVPIWKLPL